MNDRAEALQKLKSAAKRYPEFLIDEIPNGLDAVELEKRLEPVLAILPSCKPIEQDSHVAHIAKRFKISKKTIQQKLSISISNTPESPPEAEAAPVSTRNGIGRVRGSVSEDIGIYYISTPAGIDETISSFALKPKRRIIVDGSELLQCDIECESGRSVEDFIFPKKAWRSSRDFKDSLPAPDLQWTGTDDQVQGVLRLVSQTSVPTRIGATVMGYWEGATGPRWVWSGGTMGPNGMVTDEDVIYAPKVKLDIADRVRYELPSREEVVELAKTVLPMLLELNLPEVILPILGWFFATPFKPRILRLLGHFPVLMIWGTHGSGKTSIVRHIFWRLFGFAGKTEPYSCRETYHPLMTKLASTNSIPIFFDEFRLKDMGNSLPPFLNAIRRLYGGGTEERGRSDQTVASYHMLAPVVIAGESIPDHDPATMDRLLPVAPDKNFVEKNLNAKEAMSKLSSLPLHKLAGPYIQWTLSVDAEELMQRAKVASADLLRLADPRIQNRPKDNVLAMVFGLLAFDDWCTSLGVSTPRIDSRAAVENLTQNIILEGGDGGVRDSFDAFVECLSIYAQAGILQEGTHYAMVMGKLCIHLAGCHQVYMVERRKAGLGDDTNGIRALRRLCREKLDRVGSYVVGVDKRVHMTRQEAANGHLVPGFVRCIELDMTRVPETLDIDHFPVKLNRTYGGSRYGENSSMN